MVIIIGLLLFVLASVAALIMVLRNFSFLRFFAVLGCSLFVFTAAFAVFDAGWVCAFGCYYGTDIPARIAYSLFSLDYVIGYITIGSFALVFVSWVLAWFALYRRHQTAWFWLELIIPPLLWVVALVIAFTHLPNTEQDLGTWGFVALAAGLLILAGHVLTLLAAFRAEPVSAIS
jgi:hypothetical protein